MRKLEEGIQWTRWQVHVVVLVALVFGLILNLRGLLAAPWWLKGMGALGVGFGLFSIKAVMLGHGGLWAHDAYESGPFHRTWTGCKVCRRGAKALILGDGESGSLSDSCRACGEPFGRWEGAWPPLPYSLRGTWSLSGRRVEAPRWRNHDQRVAAVEVGFSLYHEECLR